jgi:hypothetical protein
METHLRPMSLGEILDRTAQLYRSNFVVFWGIAAVYAGALLVVGLANVGLTEFFRALHWTHATTWLTAGTVLVQWSVIFLIGGLAVAANNRAVAWVHLGQRATIRGAYARVWPRLRRLLWLTTILLFVLWTPLAIGYGGLLTLVIWYTPQLKNGSAQTNPMTAILFAALMLACCALIFAALVYAVLMGLRYALAVPACVVEDIPARAAIRRSIELSKGARGRVFLLGLLVVVIEFALVGLTQAFFIVLAYKNHFILPMWARAAQQIVGFFTTSLLGPIYATGLTLFYYDQRIRKEGFDIEWMMQAAGLQAPATPPSHEPVTLTPDATPAAELAPVAAQNEPAESGPAETGDTAAPTPGVPG